MASAGTANAEPQEEEQRYIVTEGSRSKIESAGFAVKRELAGGSVFIVSGPPNAVDELNSISGVEAAGRDVDLPPQSSAGWERGQASTSEESTTSEDSSVGDEAAFVDNQWDKRLMNAFEAHSTATGAGTRVAIVDSGIDDSHPDLGNVNTDLSVSFINGGEQAPHIGDVATRGTFTAGSAAATGKEGVIGVAPEAELVSIRTIDPDEKGELFSPETRRTISNILAGLDYAADIDADVVSLGLTAGPYPRQAESRAINRAVQKVTRSVLRRNTVVTGAAGNSSINLNEGRRFHLPGTVRGTMTASATGRDDNLTFYSNYGRGEIEFAAPSAGRETREATEIPEDLVFSTYPTDLGSYNWDGGTATSAAHVAGLVSLVRELIPNARPRRIEAIMARGAELVRGRNDSKFGAGRINALATVEQAA